MNPEEATKEHAGKRIRLIRDHPWAGCSAEVLRFDEIGMRVKLIRGDAYDGHEAYVLKKEHYRLERAGHDW